MQPIQIKVLFAETLPLHWAFNLWLYYWWTDHSDWFCDSNQMITDWIWQIIKFHFMWIQVNNKILADLRKGHFKTWKPKFCSRDLFWDVRKHTEISEVHNRDHSDRNKDRKALHFTWADDNRFISTSMTDCDGVCHSTAYSTWYVNSIIVIYYYMFNINMY